MDKVKDNNTMNIESRRMSWLAYVFPYLLLALAAIILGVTLLIGRIDLTTFSLVLVIPLVLGSVFLLVNRNTALIDLAAYATKIEFVHLFLVASIIFVASLIVLVMSPTRPVIYFILIALYTGVLFLEILSREGVSARGWILFQICLLSLNLIWGLTLKYPLYFGDTDLLVHMNLINTILQTGHVATFNLDYVHYPLYHLITATGIQITGIPLQTAVFVFMGIAWQAGIILAYLLFQKLSDSPSTALVASLFFASSSMMIYYGSYSIARSLAFVFFMGWIYLVFDKAQKNILYFVLSLIFLAGLILTHHLNVLYVIPILAAVYLCQLVFNRGRPERLISPLFIYLFTTASVAYFFWVSPLVANSNVRSTLGGLLDSGFLMKSSDSLTHGYGMSVIMGTIFYSFVLVFCFLGMKIVFERFQSSGWNRLAGIFALCGFFMLIVYVPGFLYILPLSDILLTDRLPLIVSPFVALLMAFGVQSLFNTRGSLSLNPVRNALLPCLALILVAATTFFSTISIGNANDTNYLPNTENINSQYFSESELQSYKFLEDNGNARLPLYADYQSTRNDLALGKFETRVILTSGDVSYIEKGYLIFRTAEMERKKALSFSPDGYQIIRYPVDKLKTEIKGINSSNRENLIYSDQDVQVYLTNPRYGPG